MCAGRCIVKAPLFTVDTGAVIAFSEKILFQEFIFIMRIIIQHLPDPYYRQTIVSGYLAVDLFRELFTQYLVDTVNEFS